MSDPLPARYSARAVIGSGGGGKVLRVFDRQRSMELAMKITSRVQGDPLQNEFEVLRQIRHRNLVHVYDRGALMNGDAYYTMEFVEGGDWACQMDGTRDTAATVAILGGILRAVGHLHSHGIVHGDMKPSNVLLTVDRTAKVSDVGAGESVSVSAATPGYAAPETWLGNKPDTRSDIYSVGVMAYEALTGRHPFQGRTIRDVVVGQLEGWVASPSALGIRLPSDLERCVMRALERDPILRQDSADEMMHELGVEDTIGEIYGGRFVDRRAESHSLSAILRTEAPGGACLILVSGPDGIGKTSLIDEVLNCTNGEFDIRGGLSWLDGQPEGLFSLAERMWEEAQNVPCLYRVPADTDRIRLRTVARYQNAISIEQGSRNRCLFILEGERTPEALEPFEAEVRVAPFSVGETKIQVSGLLGAASLPDEVVEWLHRTSGGIPGRIQTLVLSLIKIGALRRRHGTWQFHEIADLDTLLDHIPDTKWGAEWATFSLNERIIVGLLRLVPRGLRKEQIEAALSEEAAGLHELTLRGWIMQTDQGIWRMASPEVARAAAAYGGATVWGPLQDRLFAAVSAELGREEVAFLRALRAENVEDLEEGLWAIEREAELGHHKEAAVLAEHCRNRAQILEDKSLFERTSLALATALHRVGSDRDAERVLGNSEFTFNNALREHLLGVIARAQGDHSRARGHLAQAVDAAEARSDARTALSSHAELAEIDWRYGDRKTKALSIDRIRRALNRSRQWVGVEEERAGLSYQLGSALILMGEREQAREVLEEALAAKPGDYWCMRLANALATADYYLGRFESALTWMDEAWRRAENGGIDSFKARILSNRSGIYYGIGRFQDAVAMHRLSRTWARRTGNLFECSAACSGAAANLMMIAEYEEALLEADEAKEISIQIGNEYQTAKSMELSALVRFFIGDYETARGTVEDAIARMRSFGDSDVSPRLDWLLARLMRHRGDTDAAKVLLARAEQALELSRDWEDLPGVQIELELIRAREGDAVAALERILGISREANRSRAMANLLGAAVAIGEILVERGINHIECREVMSLALSKAQTAGAAEAAWQLNYLLGVLFIKDRDARNASARLGQALRGFREVADRLSPMNRGFYLRTPHGAALLASVSASKG